MPTDKPMQVAHEPDNFELKAGTGLTYEEESNLRIKLQKACVVSLALLKLGGCDTTVLNAINGILHDAVRQAPAADTERIIKQLTGHILG